MHRSASSLVARKANVCKTVVQARSMMKEAMIHSVKTGLGVSDHTYRHCNDQPEVDDEVQGTTDTPLLFTMQADVVLKAHKVLFLGLRFKMLDMGLRRLIPSKER